jgi:NAD-dependent DNA ligase
MSRAILERSTNTLIGLLSGITIDQLINQAELSFLHQWLEEHQQLAHRYPFTELYPKILTALHDRVFTKDEYEDLVWLCKRLSERQYFDQVTFDLQRLQGIVGGIASDGYINESELRGLSDWIYENQHLKSLWPYDEIEALVTGVLADQVISEEEHATLQEFFQQFTSLYDEKTIGDPLIERNGSFIGLCAVCPDLVFENAVYSFTGSSHKLNRTQMEQLVVDLGGKITNNISKKLNYLVIGAAGNPCWAYACYGRKVEQAVSLRKAGFKLQIIHESDFHDAVADAGLDQKFL